MAENLEPVNELEAAGKPKEKIPLSTVEKPKINSWYYADENFIVCVYMQGKITSYAVLTAIIEKTDHFLEARSKISCDAIGITKGSVGLTSIGIGGASAMSVPLKKGEQIKFFLGAHTSGADLPKITINPVIWG